MICARSGPATILHGLADRRAIFQTADTAARFGEMRGEQALDAGDHAFARLLIPGLEHEFGQRDIGRLDIERQVEARRSTPT
jgi:hypothetical protein